MNTNIDAILRSRKNLPWSASASGKCDEEGGCGVTGFIASVPVRGRHIYEPSVRMHNRGNGKGGGIAAVGLCAEDLGVTQDVLSTHYLLQIAYLDPESRPDVEAAHITPFMDVRKAEKIPTMDDFRDAGLEVRPPDVWRYFVRVREDQLTRFAEEAGLTKMDKDKLEDEFVFQNTIRLNSSFYASLGEKKAFVMSHGIDIMILKVVGYAEQVTQYYRLDDLRAHGWIAHQRYPTRGRMWHPGGAHPFSGMHEALVHNGDFANYHAVSEYLYQHDIYPQFLTDTEVSVMLLDLYNRTFEYPMEYIIEALAPTTEHDFDLLPVAKQNVYRYIQSQHTAGSPDGPWFFIIARNEPRKNFFQLIGITDTAMLRPQVFALQEGEVQIGLICSEKQAIDATLESLAKEDSRFCPVADKYWNARGGSATDGGAFLFTVKDSGKSDGSKELVITNKFGEIVSAPKDLLHYDPSVPLGTPRDAESISRRVGQALASANVSDFKHGFGKQLADWDFSALVYFCECLANQSKTGDRARTNAIEILAHLNDRHYPTGEKKRASVLRIIRDTQTKIFGACPKLNENSDSEYRYVDRSTRFALRAPRENEKILVVNARDFEPEGKHCDSRLLNVAYKLGWKQFVCYGYMGQRFTGCGFGKGTYGVGIDVYGSSGDYLASGIDGMEIHVHGNAQDQLGQIMKSGKLVVHGDVGQTFMYGAKGGNVFVLGNAAGRPLINGVGRPRVVINGTCLDYLAESFMAGDPLNGGGFVIVNGLERDDDGNPVSLPTPYPGSNLFSLASGGAIYIRDPFRKIVGAQLNGGELVDMTEDDWELILPYLKENEALFGISVENHLLTVDGKLRSYDNVYRKVRAAGLSELAAKEFVANEEYEEVWDKN